MDNPLYRQNKAVIFRQEQDEALLFNPDNADIVVINSTGCFIWNLCNGKNRKKDIVNSLVEEFDVSPSKAEEDLLKFLAELENKKLVEKKS